MSTEALAVEHAGHVVCVVAAALSGITGDGGLVWQRSPVPAELFPMNISPWEHMAYSIGASATSWGDVEGGGRRRRGGTVSTSIEVRWLWALPADDAVESYALMLAAERQLVDTIIDGCKRHGVRVTVQTCDRLTEASTLVPGDQVGVWVVGIIRLRADHRYMYGPRD